MIAGCSPSSQWYRITDIIVSDPKAFDIESLNKEYLNTFFKIQQTEQWVNIIKENGEVYYELTSLNDMTYTLSRPYNTKANEKVTLHIINDKMVELITTLNTSGNNLTIKLQLER